MFSFIIPTIYKSQRLLPLIETLENCDLVGEILLIENQTGSLDLSNFTKLKIINTGENLFYVKSCNLGVSLAQYPYIALCSDDINFSSKTITDVYNFYNTYPQSGYIGIHNSQYEIHRKPLYYGFGIQEIRLWGWGVLVFGQKEHYQPMPEDLVHWCGDDFMFQYSKYPVYYYYGEKMYTEMSTSSKDNPVINDIIQKDCNTYENKYKLNEPIWYKEVFDA
jgi:hypothetical protein